jgi:DNA gyrase inhibitor GyrI
MTVDIEVKQSPKYKVASLARVGGEGTDPLRKEFSELTKWAKKQKVKTGRWFCCFYESGRSPDRYRFEACLEIKRNAEPEGKIKIKELPKMSVASVKFNPEEVSPRLVYNGLYGWLRENGEYKEAASYSREVYFGNPWTNPWAWKRAEVQVPVKKSAKKKRR